MRREVTRLPPRYREAIVLYYFEERDFEERDVTTALPPSAGFRRRVLVEVHDRAAAGDGW